MPDDLLPHIVGTTGVTMASASTTQSASVVGFRLGLVQFGAVAAMGVVILVALHWLVALRRVALLEAIGFAVLCVSGATLYPSGMWSINIAGGMLVGALSILGFAAFVLLSLASFAPVPNAS